MSPNSAQVIVVSVVLVALASIAVALRFHVRKSRQSKLGPDDWTILVALFLAWLLSILLIVGSAIGGLGGHTPIDPKTGLGVDNNDTTNSGKVEYASYVIMSLTFGFIKISVVSFYRRIFVGQSFRRWSIFLLTFIGLWMIAFFLSLVLWCGSHPAAGWTSNEDTLMYCDNLADLELAFAVTDSITDLVVILTPIPILWKLQMSVNRRIALTCIFLLGFLSTASSIIRMVFVIVDIYDTTLGYRDFLGLVTNVEIWSEVEACVAVIAACLPTLRPLFAGKSPESLIGSIRSIFSPNTVKNSRSAVDRSNQEGYVKQSEEDGIHLQTIGWPNGLSGEIEITGSNSENFNVDEDHITVKNDVDYREEREELF